MAEQSRAIDCTEYRAFFGDRERTFRLTPTLIVELERQTGAGIGAVFRRLVAGEFKHADLVETVRLALIGGGENPEEAAHLAKTYAAERPVAEVLPIALGTFEALWFGPSVQSIAKEPTE